MKRKGEKVKKNVLTQTSPNERGQRDLESQSLDNFKTQSHQVTKEENARYLFKGLRFKGKKHQPLVK